MKIIDCYSFKGGTGRTTCAANISAALANMGKNVCVIDLDIEGPGLSVVMDMKDYNGTFIQDYFMDRKPESFDYKKMIIDVKNYNLRSGNNEWESLNGNLYFIPAKVAIDDTTVVDYYTNDRIPRLPLLFDLLLKKIKYDEELKIDYLVIDSASGYSETSSVGIANSDLILVFFRWSQQHLFGSITISAFLDHLCKNRKKMANYELIASCVPSSSEGEYKEKYQTLKDHFEKTVGKKIFSILPENDEMKWNEKVILFNNATNNQEIITEFYKTAEKIIDKYQD